MTMPSVTLLLVSVPPWKSMVPPLLKSWPLLVRLPAIVSVELAEASSMPLASLMMVLPVVSVSTPPDASKVPALLIRLVTDTEPVPCKVALASLIVSDAAVTEWRA